MRFHNTISDARILAAITKADSLLNITSSMLSYVIKKNDWKYDVISGIDAATKLSALDLPVARIEIYYPKYKNSDQTAAWNGERIGINGYWLPRASHEELTGALIHEWSHKIGFHHQDKGILGYVKRNYWSKEKSKHSIPYHLSDNIRQWL